MNRSHALTLFGVVALIVLQSARASAEDVSASSLPPPPLEVTSACSDHSSCSANVYVESAPRPAPALVLTPAAIGEFRRLATPEVPSPTPPVHPELCGPVDSPDGFSLMTGVFYATFPKQVLSFPTAYFSATQSAQLTLGKSHAEGAMLSVGDDEQYYSARFDIGFGAGSYSGSMIASSAGDSSSGATPSSITRAASSNPIAVDGDLVATTIDVRLGARLPSRYVALAAGGGFGGSLSFFNDLRLSSAPKVSVGAVIDPRAAWDVPLWASVDLKPACDWGIEIGASYNLQPLNPNESTISVQAGVLLQPTSICSQGGSLVSS